MVKESPSKKHPQHQPHRHPHHPHRHPHDHPHRHPPQDPHSGSTDFAESPKFGTPSHTTDTAIAALRALNGKEARHFALGQMIANLIESGHISGLGDVVKQVIAQTNRYDYVDR